MLPPSPSVDVHGEPGQDPDSRRHRCGPHPLQSGPPLLTDTALRQQGDLLHSRGLGQDSERAQLPRHDAHVRPALLHHRRAELADSAGRLAGRQRENVAEGEGLDQGLAASCSPGARHQDAAHRVERLLLSQSASLRDARLRVSAGEP